LPLLVSESYASVIKPAAPGVKPGGTSFMKHSSPNWPVLIQDYNWREQKREGHYWHSYFRRNRVAVQRITHNETFGTEAKPAWVLEVGARYIAHGTLSAMIHKANLVTR